MVSGDARRDESKPSFEGIISIGAQQKRHERPKQWQLQCTVEAGIKEVVGYKAVVR